MSRGQKFGGEDLCDPMEWGGRRPRPQQVYYRAKVSLGDWICRKEGRSSVSPLASLARVESLYFLQILNSEMVLMLLECVHVEQQRSREY